MGQLLSRQATSNKSQTERTPSTARNCRLRHVGPFDASIDDDQGRPKSVHWNGPPPPTYTTANAQGSGSRSQPLPASNGNVGTPSRQLKHESSKTTPGLDRSKDHSQKRTQKNDDAKLRLKEHHHAREHASKSRLDRGRSHRTKECIVCTDSRTLHRFPSRPPTEQCTHAGDVCRRCLRTWIQSEFRIKIWNEINCPMCATRMQYDDIREFAPREVFRRYDKLTTKAMYDSIPNHRWCLTKGCKSGQVHPPGISKFRCRKCRKSHCVQHNVPWHKGETCHEFDYRKNRHIKKQEEAASKKTISETTKKCPGCKRSIEKSFGCDHMTCLKCKHEFCWQCGATYPKKDIRRVAHRQGCEFYTPD